MAAPSLIDRPGAEPSPDEVPDEAVAPSIDRTEGGFTVVSAVWVMAVTLVLVTAFANLFVQRYAQAVIRQATDEGARAWALNGGTQADCAAAASDVVGDLLGGPMVSEISFNCVDQGTTVAVTARATLAAMPPLADSVFVTTATVTKELEENLVLP